MLPPAAPPLGNLPPPLGLILATLTTNIAANVVAPANALVNAAPRLLTFRGGGVLTALLGLCTMPWKLYGGFLNFLVCVGVGERACSLCCFCFFVFFWVLFLALESAGLLL